MEQIEIRRMAERRFESIPIGQIEVIDSRLREEEQFQMNVQSIENTGLLMPIRVNDGFLEETGKYELICGEGRLIAHTRLGRTTIAAEVVTCTRKEAYLQSLIENIARAKAGTMDFARELKRLKDEGWDLPQIARVACKSPEYIRDYIRLVEQGEDRLIRGVEQKLFSITFAVYVAQSEDANVQNVLMDAFDQGIVNSQNFGQARKLIEARVERRKRDGHRKESPRGVTVSMLKKDIVSVTKSKDSFVREVKTKENRFLTLLMSVNTLWRDEDCKTILAEEKLVDRPDLTGDFQYETECLSNPKES